MNSYYFQNIFLMGSTWNNFLLETAPTSFCKIIVQNTQFSMVFKYFLKWFDNCSATFPETFPKCLNQIRIWCVQYATYYDCCTKPSKQHCSTTYLSLCSGDPKAVTFSSVFAKLDSLDSSLNLGWSAAKILHIARQDTLPPKTYLRWVHNSWPMLSQKFIC